LNYKEDIMTSVKDNLNNIRKDINDNVTIVAVTKYYDVDNIIEAYNAGLRDFGEAKVIEAINKLDELPDDIKKSSKFHLIGHLQTNKASKAVGYFDLIQSVDSIKLANIISKEAIKQNITQDVLLQLNIAKEKQKYGFYTEDLFNAFNELINLKGIKITGLMCMAPLNADNNDLNEIFTEVINIKEKLEKKYNIKLKDISMGMSDDYIEAVKCGSTMIRIGTKLFV